MNQSEPEKIVSATAQSTKQIIVHARWPSILNGFYQYKQKHTQHTHAHTYTQTPKCTQINFRFKRAIITIIASGD